MKQFTEKLTDRLLGVLSGFDRLRFRGTLLLLTSEGGMMEFLWQNQVLLTDFREYVATVTERVRLSGERLAARSLLGKVHYLPTTRISKEQFVQDLIRRQPDREGLIAVLSCVEPCRSFDVHKDAVAKRLRLRLAERQCLHHYFYFRHRELGLLHVRLQTWFPFTIHVCLNGREWLARKLDRSGIGYTRRDNCFTRIDNVRRAQRLFDNQLRKNWPALLSTLQGSFHPMHRQITARCPMDYYWTVDESEWATDLMFGSPAELARLYPRLVRHGMLAFDCHDVLRFLGRKQPGTSEVNSDVRARAQGIRIKHRVNGNSIKMYDKEHSVLRVETTLLNPRDFRVYRPSQADPEGPADWRTMRKGVADLHRRAEVSQAANERYLSRLAAVEDDATVAELSAPICRRRYQEGRSWRALNPLADDDARLLAAVSRGEFAINGFRNRDLQTLLYADTTNPAERRRRSTQLTRRIKLLRMHGLISKVPRTHRYTLTKQGQTIIATLLAMREASTKQLTQAV